MKKFKNVDMELVSRTFPKTISEQQLDSSPAIQCFNNIDVGFKYRYWKNLTDESELPKPLLDRLQNVIDRPSGKKIIE